MTTPVPTIGRSAVLRVLAILVAVGLGAFAYHQLGLGYRIYRIERAAANPPTAPSLSEPARLSPLPVAKPPGLDASTSKDPIALVLTGTQPGRNASEGIASIGTSPEGAQMYATGAVLANGSRLIEVHADHVVLTHGPGKVALYVDARPPQALTSDSRLSTSQTIEQQVVYVGGQKSKGKEFVAEPGYSLASVVRTQPVFANGQLKGLQLVEGSNQRLFAALGFRQGDLLIAIDGARVEIASQAEDFFGALDSGAPVALTIEREGHLEHLNVDVAAARSAGATATEEGTSAVPASPANAG